MSEPEPTQLTLAGDERPKTKYTFLSTDTGCLVEREGGWSCAVEYRDTWLYVNGVPCGVYDEHRLERLLAETFADWISPGRSKYDREECIDMIQRALKSRIFAQWKRIVTYIVPEEVEELARKMFNSTVGDAVILHVHDLYTDEWKHLRSDLKKYAACRMYAKHLEDQPPSIGIVSLKKASIPIDMQLLLDNASRWRERLTPAVPYKALNKTLDSISWGISWKHLHRLSTMRLETPITTRLHLAFALAASDHHNWGLHERIVLAANDQAVIQAGEIHGYAISLRTRKDTLIDLAHRVLDYPEPYGGDLLGLARRSEEWHNRPRPLQVVGSYKSLSADSPLPLLPLDYDKLAEEGITPLRTAGDCYREHEIMGHCVDGYATKAQRGLCYLFHVERTMKDKDGNLEHTQATIELLPDGNIGQAEGPNRDRNNAACHYGIQRLRWAYGTMVKGQAL